MSKLREKAEARTEQIIGQMLGDELLLREGEARSRKAQKATDSPGEDASPQTGGNDQGIVRDGRGQEQPRDKERAQRVSRVDKGDDPPGKRE